MDCFKHPMRPPQLPKSSHDWPASVPSAADWTAWRNMSLRVFPGATHSLPRSSRLGKWFKESHQHFRWFLDPLTHELCREDEHDWTVFRHRQGTSTRQEQHSRHRRSQTAPVEPPLATVAPIWNTNRCVLTGASQGTTTAPTHVKDSVIHLIDGLGEAGWPLHISNFDHARRMAKAMHRGLAVAVSDGSHKPMKDPTLGAAAWTLCDTRTERFCNGLLRATGDDEEVNAHRAEWQGIHALLLGVWALCQVFHVTSGSIVMACDNDGVIRKCTSDNPDPPPNAQHVDLIRACLRLVRDLPMSIQFAEVAGHQDNKGRDLSLLESLNVPMDPDAKAHLDSLISRKQTNRPPDPPTTPFGEGIQVFVGDKKIAGDPHKETLHWIHRGKMKAHSHEKGKLHQAHFDFVDWEGIGWAADLFPPLFQLWVTKHVSGECAVGRRMLRWGFWANDNCPCCHQPNETARHVPFCSATSMTDNFHAGLDRLETKLHDLQTHQGIIDCWMATLLRRERTESFEEHASTDTLAAARAQDDIGLENLLEGRMAKAWGELQHDHLLSDDSRRISRTWRAAAITAPLEFAHSMWTHRCGISHERDEQGLPLAKGISLKEALTTAHETTEFNQLLPEDHHLLENCTLGELLAATPVEKETWLHAMDHATSLFVAASSGSTLAAEEGLLEVEDDDHG